MTISKTMGRSMTVIGFAILLIVALSACSKKKHVAQPGGDVGIFEIALPNESNPSLRDYTSDDLGKGNYEVSRLGFRVESWPSNASPGFRAELWHTLGVVGTIDPLQDQISSNNVRTDGGEPLEIEFSFEFGDWVNLNTFGGSTGNSYSAYGYVATFVGDNEVRIDADHNNPDLDRITHILTDENRLARGVYKSGDIQAFVLKTNNGFSVYFVVYDDQVRVVGRIDYLYMGQ